MLDRLRRRPPTPPGFDPEETPNAPRETIVEAPDGSFSCHAVDSPDNRWTLAYGRHIGDGGSRAFRLRDGEIDSSFRVDRPAAGAVANDGTFAIVERDGSNTTKSHVRAFVGDTETLARTFESTVRDVVVIPSGGTVAIATRRPDASVYAYDTRTGSSNWAMTPRRAVPRLLGFHGDEEQLVYVSREKRQDPYLAIDPSGDVAWGNERYQSTRPFTERVRSFVSRK